MIDIFKGAHDREDNGYGVPLLAIQQAWIPFGKTPDATLPDEDALPSFEPNEGRRPLVVIDPGHGSTRATKRTGYDLGHEPKANDPEGITEIDVIDSVSNALAQSLYDKGFAVAFTREPYEKFPFDYKEDIGPQNISSREVRADYAHKLGDIMGAKDVYLISVHANYFAARNPRSESQVEYAKNVRGAFVCAAARSNNNGRIDFGGPLVDKRAGELVKSIAENYQIDPDTPTDARTADMAIIKRFERLGEGGDGTSNRTAAFIELGFMHNIDDAKALKAMIDDPCIAADQISDGIHSFHQRNGATAIKIEPPPMQPVHLEQPQLPQGQILDVLSNKF